MKDGYDKLNGYMENKGVVTYAFHFYGLIFPFSIFAYFKQLKNKEVNK